MDCKKRKHSVMLPKTFHGIITLDDISIAVDNFTKFNGIIYFLSHIHSDHIKGLTDRWDKGIIYCSDITSKLISFTFPNISKQAIRSLSMDFPHAIDLGNSKFIVVTLLEANHCPGSCMFMFDYYDKRILYTGDVRINNDILSNKVLTEKPFDQLYLDTTFAGLRVLPSIDKCIDQIVCYISSLDKHKQVFINNTVLGIELLLATLSRRLQTRIHVSKFIFSRTSYFDAGLASACMITTFHNEQSCIHCGCDCKFNKDHDIIIKPSVFWHTNNKKENNIVHMLYARHSSFAELLQLIGVIDVINIINITDCDKDIFNSLKKHNMDI